MTKSKYTKLIGQEFHWIKVENVFYSPDRGAVIAKCICTACNNQIELLARPIAIGKTKSCGCVKERPKGINSKRFKDLTGQVFGLLTVSNIHDVGDNRKTMWNCDCSCGGFKRVYASHLIQGYTKSCGCTHYKKGNRNPLWKGYEEISGKYWNIVQIGAKERNIIFDLTITDAWDIFIEQERKCALSGQSLYMNDSASLDRIDSTKGYTVDNVQWVHKTVNIIKWNLPENEFIELCTKIANYNL